MLRSHTLSLVLGAAVLCAPSFAQRGHRNPPDIFQDQTNLPAATSRGPDPKAMLELANELQQLSDSIPGEVGKVTKGTISKDLGARLKKIEKLAKKLREEVQQ
jgi:hypothetical protein